MKWRATSKYSWITDDGYVVARFHIDGTDILGVTPPGGTKPEFHGDRAAVLEWIESNRRKNE